MKYVECVDKKRTISAYYYEKLRSGARYAVVRDSDDYRDGIANLQSNGYTLDQATDYIEVWRKGSRTYRVWTVSEAEALEIIDRALAHFDAVL